MVLQRAAAAPVQDLEVHGARDDVPRGEVFGCGCVALHQALAVRVQEVAAFAAGAFGYEDLWALGVRRMSLGVGG